MAPLGQAAKPEEELFHLQGHRGGLSAPWPRPSRSRSPRSSGWKTTMRANAPKVAAFPRIQLRVERPRRLARNQVAR